MQDGFEQCVRVPDFRSEHPIQFVGWLVSDQSLVIPGERIAEIMCDGSVVHVEATQAGVIWLDHSSVESLVKPGDLLARIRSQK